MLIFKSPVVDRKKSRSGLADATRFFREMLIRGECVVDDISGKEGA